MAELADTEREQYLLTKRVAGFLVLEEMGAVRQALGQIRSIVADSVNPLSAAIQAIGSQGDAPGVQAEAVRSMQFADMVEQLAAYCDAELDNVECLARDLNDLVNGIMHDEDDAHAHLLKFQTELSGRLESLRSRLANRGHKSVTQDNMTQGDIELF